MEGPEVATSQVLEAGNVNMILPYVHKLGKEEEEVRKALERVMAVRKDGAQAREVAELYSFETVARIHRAGEGALYTGLKPAGLSEGPIIPLAGKAIETRSPNALVDILCDTVREEVLQKFDRLIRLTQHAGHGADAAYAYVLSMLGTVCQGPHSPPIRAARHGPADQSS